MSGDRWHGEHPEGALPPNPGSHEAVNAGCTCPILDNAHGKGRYCDGEKHGWWITEGCPLHGD